MKLLTIILAVLLTSLQGCSKQVPVVINQCNLDSLQGATPLTDINFSSAPKNKLKASGWFANVAAGKTPEEVTIIFIDQTGAASSQGAGSAGAPRPDVAKVLNKEALKNSGYAINIELNGNLPSGMYRILLNGNIDGQIGVCDTGRSINIEAN